MVNYTDEDTKLLIELYTQAEDPHAVIPELAKRFDKSEKSIIGKLAKEGVYIKKQYVNKQGKPPITKKEMIHKIAVRIGGDPERMQGLEKAPKIDLEYLLEVVSVK